MSIVEEPHEPSASDPPVVPEPRVAAGHRSRRLRLVAGAAAVAVAAGAAGVGVGRSLGGGTPSDSTQASQQGSTNSQTPGLAGPGVGGSFGQWQGGQGGNGDWGNLAPQRSTTDAQTTKASGSQLTGLVRIASTLVNGLAAGTGIILTSDGEVVTNNHVVEGSTKLRVTVMSTHTTYTARVVGTDAKDDVAVLQLVGASGLSTVTPDNDGVSPNDAVTAVGDADGTTGYLSAATGTVRDLGQAITTQTEGDASSERLTGLIEIAANVIAGDSGGSVLDDQGEVVGMTTAASAGPGESTGYAIPIAKVLSIAQQMESGQETARIHLGYDAFLGVELSTTAKAPTVAGVLSGTPAASAGITRGDVITSVAGTQLATAAQLRTAIKQHSVGDSVTVTWRDASGATHSATVTLTTAPVD